MPIVLTMRQPPDERAEPDGGVSRRGPPRAARRARPRYPRRRAGAMMPIVFCASLAAVAEAVERRGHELQLAEEPSTRAGGAVAGRPRARGHHQEKPSTKPEQRREHDEESDLGQPGRHERAEAAPWRQPAPAKPPMSACEELDGMPKYHVMRFHVDGADERRQGSPTDRRCSTRRCPCRWSSPPAHRSERATKLKKAAHATACLGVSTRVETTVAIELAASWKPLM